MSKKKSSNKKGIIIAVFVVLLVGVVVALVCLLNQKQDSFEYEGWIDCQPVLSPEEEDLCRRARDAGYPYIAY